MDLGLTEAQEILKTTAANFIQQEYPKETIIALESTPTGVTPELFRKVAALGWLGIAHPRSLWRRGAFLYRCRGALRRVGTWPGAWTVFFVRRAGGPDRIARRH